MSYPIHYGQDLKDCLGLIAQASERLSLLKTAEHWNEKLDGHLEGDYPDLSDALHNAEEQFNDLVASVEAYTGNACVVPAPNSAPVRHAAE